MSLKLTVSLISLALLMLSNLTVTVWWASGLDKTVQDHESRIATLATTTTNLAMQQNSAAVSLARIEENQRWSIDTLQQVRDQVNQIPTKRAK